MSKTQALEVTFVRALKIWWSFIWRSWVLAVPFSALVLPLLFWVQPFPRPEEAPMMWNQFPSFIGRFFLVWILFVGGMIFFQTLAMRWMTKTRWSDFRLVAVPSLEPEIELETPAPEGDQTPK